jgi:histidyl-tRNA synthetase
VVHQGEATEGLTWKTAGYLRDQGINVILHCGGGSFKVQMRKADASGARFAIIIGDNEVQAGVISVKPLREEAKQVKIGLTEAVGLLKGI